MKGTRRRSVFRRRESGQTDYHRRLKLLRGKKARAVVRVSNTRVTCQMVNWSAGGDLVLATVAGSDLAKKFDWPEDFSQKSVPACYLTGFALGKAAMAQGCTDAVLDIGLAGSTPGGRVFSALRVWSMQEWTFHTVMQYFLKKTELTVNTFPTKFLLQ